MTDLAKRIRSMLVDDPNSGEMRMFGGTCFTLNGNMLVVARGKGGLMARVGKDAAPLALARPGVKRMVMRGREMADFITVPDDDLDDEALRGWIAMATAYVGALPPKAAKDPASAGRKPRPEISAGRRTA